MKKIQLILLVTLGLFSSCDVDETLVSEISPEALADQRGIEAITAGAYAHLASSRLYGGRLSLILMTRGDMVSTYPTTSGERIALDRFDVNDANGRVATTWEFFFKAIANCNTALSGANTIGDEEERNRASADARFVRGFSYYHLVRLFGEVPLLFEEINTSAGADALNDIERASVDQVYEQMVIPDLEFAKEWLADRRNGDDRSRASRGTAAGYLASVHLTRENYQSAYDEAKFVIDNRGTFNYSLETNFQDLFNAEKAATLTEPLFSVPFTSLAFDFPFQDDIVAPLTGVPINGNFRGFGSLVPTFKVFESFNPDDYRRDVSFQTDVETTEGELVNYLDFPAFSSNADQPALPHVAKFRRFIGNANRPVGRESDFDFIAMRYAEVLLIAAEASNRLVGPTSEAYDYINQLRARARLADGTERTEPADLALGLSQQDFEEAIIEERRVELAFEFKRWYDIVRLRIGNEVFSGPNAYEDQSLFNENKYLLPIPFNQLTFNTGWEQNQGY